MKNIAKHFQLTSFTRWTYTNHEDWCDDPIHSVLNVRVERITVFNGEVISKETIESQDHVVNVSTPESMAAEACLRMSSIHIDEEVYVGF